MVVRVGSRGARCVTAEAGHTFVAATEEFDGGTAVVSVVGEVDVATAPALEQTLLGVADGPTRTLIVDLTDCGFLECRGLRVLIAARARREDSKTQLALVLPTPSPLRIFQVTGLDDVFDVYPSRAAAADVNGNGHG